MTCIRPIEYFIYPYVEKSSPELQQNRHWNMAILPLTGIDMSGRRPLIKGYFAVLRLIADAVMSSACLMRVMTPVGPDVVR